MRYFKKGEKATPKDTSLPRLHSDVKLEKNLVNLENAYKEFSKTLEEFVSSVKSQKDEK